MELEACYKNFMSSFAVLDNKFTPSSLSLLDTFDGVVGVKECPIVEENLVFPVPDQVASVDFARHVVDDPNFFVSSFGFSNKF